MPDSQPAVVPEPDFSAPDPPNPPDLAELFVAFARMSLAGLAACWSGRGMVEQHRWMTEEFNDTVALCHFPPVRTSSGLIGPPMAITMTALCAHFGEIKRCGGPSPAPPSDF